MKAYPDCNGDRVKTCPDCNGDGVVDKDTDDERQCPTCGGLGFVPDDDDHEEVIKTSRSRSAWPNVGGNHERNDQPRGVATGEAGPQVDSADIYELDEWSSSAA